jgi:hypothetical protein
MSVRLQKRTALDLEIIKPATSIERHLNAAIETS